MMAPKKRAGPSKKTSKRQLSVSSESDALGSNEEVQEVRPEPTSPPPQRRHRVEGSPAKTRIPFARPSVNDVIDIAPEVPVESPLTSEPLPPKLRQKPDATRPTITSAERLNLLTANIQTVFGNDKARDHIASVTSTSFIKDDSADADLSGVAQLRGKMSDYATRFSGWRVQASEGLHNEVTFSNTILSPHFDTPCKTGESLVEGVCGRDVLLASWNACHNEVAGDLTSLPQAAVLFEAADDAFTAFSKIRDEGVTAGRGQLWSQKYAFPFIPTTSHVEAFNTFKNWVRSWGASGTVADNVPEVRSPLLGLVSELPRPEAPDSLMLRISARNMEREQRAQEQHEAKMSKNKGYFKVVNRDTSAWANSTSTLSNIAVLSGAHGLGKTTLVEAVAKASNSYVIDINTSVQRSAANIEKAFREATQARKLGALKQAGDSQLGQLQDQLAKMQQRADAQKAKQPPITAVTAAPAKPDRKGLTQDAIAKFFAKPQKRAQPEIVDTPPPSPVMVEPTPPPAPVFLNLVDAPNQSAQNPLILLDAGDVVFPDENGFHSAVCRIATSSKCPVIVTSNTEYSDDALKATFGEGTPQFNLVAPDAYLVVFYLMAVDMVERRLAAVPDPTWYQNLYRRTPNNDLRRMMNAMQWDTSRVTPRTSSVIQRGEWRSQRILDVTALCRNVLDEITWKMENIFMAVHDENLIHYDPDLLDPEDTEIEEVFRSCWNAARCADLHTEWICPDVEIGEIAWNHGGHWISSLAELQRDSYRQPFGEGGWSVGLGQRVERDEMRAKCESHRSKRQKWFIHHAESSDALVDFLPGCP